MDAMGNQPDEVTQAALEAVSEAVELADPEGRQQTARGGPGPRGRGRRPLARRAAPAGQAVPRGRVDRMTAYVGAWAQRRGVALAPGGLVLAAGSPLARQLQRRLAARAGRSIFSLGPLLTGAVAGGMINRRETRKLGRILSDDLRKRSPHASGWPD